MKEITPYEFHEGELGVKVKFLVSDSDKRSPESFDFIKYRSLSHRLASNTCTERQLRRASLGFEALVVFDSLCPEWKDSIEEKYPKPKPQPSKGFFEKYFEKDRKAFDYFCGYRFGEDNERKLPPEVIEKYTYNASVLNAVIAVKTNRKAYIKAIGGGLQVNIWESLSRDVNAFNAVAHDLPTTPTTLRHKVTKYQKEGYESIISKKYGQRNAANVKNEKQWALLEELLKKHQNLNNEQVAYHYNMFAKVAGWDTLSGSSVANYRKELDLYTFAGRRGMTEFIHQKRMQVKRHRPSLPMIYWTLDGWDAELLYQKTDINKNGHSVTTYTNRLTAVMVLDPFNDYIIGYAIGERESPTLIKQAMKNAINHTRELFGDRYKPYQLQADNYQKKKMAETYQFLTKHFTPSEVKNAKSKIIEPFFDKFNEQYFQKELAINWSGHNVNAQRKNQPNADYLNKVRHLFPTEYECRMQIIKAIEADRSQKVEFYKEQWVNLPQEDRLPMSLQEYLRIFGETTGYTNRLQSDGITPTIGGKSYAFDCFDLNFRKYAHTDWCLLFDPEDLSKVLAINAESHHGKLVKSIDTLEFVLEQKYIQPMALYDRKEGDGAELQKVMDYNALQKEIIIERGTKNTEILRELYYENPQLETLQKLLIVDSAGQHKDHKSAQRLAIEKVTKKQEKQAEKILETQWKHSQEEYLKDKVQISKYF